MAKVIMVRDEEKAWEQSFVDRAAQTGAMKQGMTFKRILPTTPGMPNMQRVRFEANYIEPVHSHPEDEVISIVDGSIAFGRDILRRGDTLFVAKDSRYSLRAGDEGAEFLRVGMPRPAEAS